MRRDHAAEMAEAKRQFDAGKKRAILDALFVCVCSHPEKPVPTWVKKGLFQAIYDVMTVKAVSWDDVFGKPHIGRKVAQLRKQRAIQWPVFRRVEELRWQKPKPREIYAIVGKEFKISAATAKRYYEHVNKSWFSKAAG